MDCQVSADASETQMRARSILHGRYYEHSGIHWPVNPAGWMQSVRNLDLQI